MSEKRLERKRGNRMFLGVAAGIADYLNIDPVLVRLIFVLMVLAGGHGILIYLILAIIMPEEAEPIVSAKADAFDEDEIVVKGA